MTTIFMKMHPQIIFGKLKWNMKGLSEREDATYFFVKRNPLIDGQEWDIEALSKMIKTGVLDMFYIEELVNSNPQIVEEWDNEEWEGIGMCFAVNCNKTYNECVSQIKTIGGRKDRKIKMNPKAKAKAKEKAKMKG